MIKGVVFDLDHTLFDRYATLTAIMPSFMERFNISDDFDLERLTDTIIYADKHFVHFGWAFVLDYLTKIGVFISAPDLSEYTEFLLSSFTKIAVEYEFTKPMLTALRNDGYKTGLITNGNPEIQNAKLRILGLYDYFDEIVISGDIGFAKPKPEPFFIMAQRLNVLPCELIYAGDNPLNDIEGSRNAGYIPVWVRTMGWVFDNIEKPEFSVKNAGEIPKLIKGINF